MHSIITRRDLLLLGAVFPTMAVAVIPPPPSSPWYLIFIADGIYRISNLYTVTLPASAGTCRNYTAVGVSQAFGANFTFTGRSGISAWNLLLGAPEYRWWEVLDKRNGKYVRIWKYDRIEAKFADRSRVKVVFNGPDASIRFQPLVGTERLPDGTRLYPRRVTGDNDGSGGRFKSRGSRDTGVTNVTPTSGMYSWHWGDQEVPW